MILDENDLRDGLKFIVGTWQVDYVVNAFSNDLSHIPAAEFKSSDGRDFSVITFEFFEDHTTVLRDAASGKEERGTWEQTGWGSYRYTLGAFIELPEGAFREAAEKLEVIEGCLVFSIGFLAIGMKKIADGVVTEPEKEPDIGDIEMTAEDLAATGIVGTYGVAKAFAMVDGKFGLFSREDVAADLEKRRAAGEIDDEEIDDALRGFELVTEFTADHRVVSWMKIPKNVTEDMIKAAQEAGEIGEVRDGRFAAGSKEWKSLGGKYYYDSGEHREVFGEVKSSWDELTFDEDGLLSFGEMMKLRRILYTKKPREGLFLLCKEFFSELFLE